MDKRIGIGEILPNNRYANIIITIFELKLEHPIIEGRLS